MEGTITDEKNDLNNVLQFPRIKRESNDADTYIDECVNKNAFEKIFIKSENHIKNEDIKIEPEVLVKSEPEGFEEESENAVKNKDFEFEPGSELSRRKEHSTEEVQKAFMCSQCDFTTKYKRNLKQHIVVIHNKAQAKSLSCNDCSYKTFNPARMKTHSRLHMQDCPYSCDVCHMKYIYQSHLDNHIISKHPKSNQAVKTKIHACGTCNFKSVFPAILAKHVQLVHNKDTAPVFNCTECSFKTLYTAQLKAHHRLHTQELPFKCDECHKKFSHRRHLDNHILTKHPESEQVVKTRIHRCQVCDFKSVYMTYLTKHILTVHDHKDLSKFRCEHCDYCTDKKYDLNRHVLTHAGAKPFACPECSKDFTTKSHLDSHMLHRHSDNESILKLITSKIHYCQLCDYKAVNTTHLNAHIRSRHNGKM